MESPRTLVQSLNQTDPSTAPVRPDPFRAHRPAAPPGDPSEGEQLVLERYRLLERLGAGGFGVVWRARDELLQREVAVKRIWLGAGGDGERAAREAHASARLSHPAIVALYEACPVGDAFYLISELVEGQTLARMIAEDTLADRHVLAIGLALVDALEHAHARGVIHRDIKPQNVLVPHRPQAPRSRQQLAAAKLTDFGGASLADEDVLTRTGDVLGTLAYMAPEQSEGREVREQADLYALALVLHEALAGTNPVRGATPAETARRIGTRLPSLARRRRDLPRGLSDALDQALSPRPRDRGTLEDLRLALHEGLTDEHGLAADEHGLAADEHRAHAPEQRTRRRPRRAVGLSEGPGLHRAATTSGAAAGLHRAATLSGAAAGVEAEGLAVEHEPSATQPRALPRALWLALALAGAGWQAAAGRPGVSLLLLAALAPLLVLPAARRGGGLSPSWLLSALAPLLGLAGLAGVYPALAGQATRWRERLALGALGYWWLTLAEPLLGRRLWLGSHASPPSRSLWEGSLQHTANDVIGPILSTGVVLGALLWAVAALLLPVVVRGRNAALDVVAAVTWSAAVAAVAPRLDAGLGAAATHPSPRGAVLGAVLGGMLAVGARALRGPV